MRIDRFFIDVPIVADRIILQDEGLIHQWRNVFRYQTGTQVILLDNSGYEYKALIESLTNRETACLITNKKKAGIPSREIWLCLSLIRKERFELALEKAVELGVSHIVPIRAEFSIERRMNKTRLLKIIKEASEQCGRGTMPALHEEMSLKNAIEYVKTQGVTVVICHKDGERASLPELNASAVFVGPEGGWSKKEEILFKDLGIRVSLSDFILRAETAAIVALSRFL